MTKTHKFFRSLLALGSILWIGAAVSKSALIFDLFIPGTLDLKPEYGEQIRMHTAYLYSIVSGYSIAGFFIVLLSAIFMFPAAKKNFKSKGYLLMCYALLVIFAPIEIYRQILDIKLAYAFKFGSIKYGFIDSQIREYLLSQFNGALGAVTTLASFAFITCAILLAWRPLYRRPHRISIDE